jgi:hypothetical protein
MSEMTVDIFCDFSIWDYDDLSRGAGITVDQGGPLRIPPGR